MLGNEILCCSSRASINITHLAELYSQRKARSAPRHRVQCNAILYCTAHSLYASTCFPDRLLTGDRPPRTAQPVLPSLDRSESEPTSFSFVMVLSGHANGDGGQQRQPMSYVSGKVCKNLCTIASTSHHSVLAVEKVRASLPASSGIVEKPR